MPEPSNFGLGHYQERAVELRHEYGDLLRDHIESGTPWDENYHLDSVRDSYAKILRTNLDRIGRAAPDEDRAGTGQELYAANEMALRCNRVTGLSLNKSARRMFGTALMGSGVIMVGNFHEDAVNYPLFNLEVGALSYIATSSVLQWRRTVRLLDAAENLAPDGFRDLDRDGIIDVLLQEDALFANAAKPTRLQRAAPIAVCAIATGALRALAWT